MQSIGLIIDEQLRVVELIGYTALRTNLLRGEVTLRLPDLLTPSLHPAVLEALEQARQSKSPVHVPRVEYLEVGLRRFAALTVSPVKASCWRIELNPQEDGLQGPTTATAPVHSADDLAVELEAANDELRATITELVAANQEILRGQAALEQSRNDLRERYDFIAAVLDTVGALVLVLDPNGRVLEFNRACESLTGFSQSDARGRLVWTFIPQDHIPETESIFGELVSGAYSNAHENDWLASDGSRRRIAWTNTTMRDQDGHVAYVIATGIDVTSRHKAERSLQISEAKFRAVVENAAEAILGVDAAGKIKIANPAAAQLFGYSRDELLQTDLLQLIPESFRPAHAAHHQSYSVAPRTRPMASGAEMPALRKDGAEVPVEISLSSISAPEGDLTVAFIQDVTDRVAYRRHLQSLAGKLLKAQEEERRRIARNIHDDLTQTISLLGMKLGFLKQEVDSAHKKLLDRLEEARQQVDLIHDKVRAISHRLHPSTLEYSGLVPALESLVSDADVLERPRVHLVADPLPETIPTATTVALYRIAQEAVHNAVKSADAENVSIHVAANDGHLSLVVIDDGCGFKPDPSRRSAGLGLISMEERARDLGGHFAVHSAPGSGTRVEVDVPFAPSLN